MAWFSDDLDKAAQTSRLGDPEAASVNEGGDELPQGACRAGQTEFVRTREARSWATSIIVVAQNANVAWPMRTGRLPCVPASKRLSSKAVEAHRPMLTQGEGYERLKQPAVEYYAPEFALVKRCDQDVFLQTLQGCECESGREQRLNSPGLLQVGVAPRAGDNFGVVKSKRRQRSDAFCMLERLAHVESFAKAGRTW